MEIKRHISRRDFLNVVGGVAAASFLPHGRAVETNYTWPPGVRTRFDTDEPYFALTIDDGWNAETFKFMLDVMHDEGMQSTFFLVGDAAKIAEIKIPGILKRVIDEGHTIGYHSMDHGEEGGVKGLEERTSSWWAEDYEEWVDTMRNLLGADYFAKGIRPYARAPYALFTQAFINMCLSKNLNMYGWRDDPSTLEKGDIVLIHVNQRGLDYIRNLDQYTKGLVQPATIDCFEEGTCANNSDNSENRSYYWTLDAPPSLMLHSKDYRLLQQLIPDLRARFSPTTYRDWLKTYQQKKQFSDANPSPYYFDGAHQRLIRSSQILSSMTPPLVISIDDVGTSWIRREHLQIIEDLREANMPSVIGLQPNLEPDQGGKYWDLIRQLHQEGWEIASHTINHYKLPELSLDYLRRELSESAKRIEEGIGEAPITLIVPGGDIWPNDQYEDIDERIFEVAYETGYKIVAGIGKGRKIEGELPFYFGRAVPDPNAAVTLQRLANFNSE